MEKSSEKSSINIAQLKKQALFFVVITLLLTFAYNALLYVTFKDITQAPGYSTLIQMLIPAMVAIFCLFSFKDTGIKRPSKIFFGLFTLYVIVFFWEMLVGPIIPYKFIQLPIYRFMPTLSILIAVFSIIILFSMNLKRKWMEELSLLRLSFGRNLKYYLILGVIFTVLLFLVYFLNYLLEFGPPLDKYSLSTFTLTFLINLSIGFFVGWPFYFGEEYGWRVYLQDRLFPIFGGIKGVLLLGLIWGLWHSGLIIMGMNYPEQPLLGNMVMFLLTIVVGIFYSYAVLKTGSVWIAVLLHMIIDTLEPIAWFYMSYPSETIFCFGMGLYGILILGIFALLLILADGKVWKRDWILKNYLN
ncbi:MAG TPA: CPBP family intramembrane metalloprotease [Methanobacterium sp.]|nr:CPBP family intramembrane metalloprotease [Methanobacterium sp.]